MTTTIGFSINEARAFGPCVPGWKVALKCAVELPPNEIVPIVVICRAIGPVSTSWGFRIKPEYEDVCRDWCEALLLSAPSEHLLDKLCRSDKAWKVVVEIVEHALNTGLTKDRCTELLDRVII